MSPDPVELNVTEDDGLRVREAGPWTMEKLEVVARYLPRFGQACSKRAPGWCVADAFCGPGVNRIRETGELIYGSPLLALQATPAYECVLMLDLDTKNIDALKKRVARIDPTGTRGKPYAGNCNTELVPMMEKHFNEKAPTLVILDPEGSELEWSTIAGVARFRVGKTKAEQLVLFTPQMAWQRLLPVDEDPPSKVVEDLDRMFGHHEWWAIYQAKRAGEISASRATAEYVKLYANGFRELGYKWVLDRKVRTSGDAGQPLYHLVFATQHEAGYRIMDSILDVVGSGGTQPRLFTVRRDSTLDGTGI